MLHIPTCGLRLFILLSTVVVDVLDLHTSCMVYFGLVTVMLCGRLAAFTPSYTWISGLLDVALALPSGFARCGYPPELLLLRVSPGCAVLHWGSC